MTQKIVKLDANLITNTSSGNISSTDVQSALNELDSEKAGLSLANIFTAIQEITNTTTATSTTTGALKLPNIGIGNGVIYLLTPSTTDNTQKAATTAFVNNYIARGADSNSIQYIRFGNSSGSGLLVKFQSSVVTISSNTATITYSGTPAFNSMITIIVCNGDSTAADTPVHVSSYSTTQFTIRTSSFASGSFRLNWLAFGVPS